MLSLGRTRALKFRFHVERETKKKIYARAIDFFFFMLSKKRFFILIILFPYENGKSTTTR